MTTLLHTINMQVLANEADVHCQIYAVHKLRTTDNHENADPRGN